MTSATHLAPLAGLPPAVAAARLAAPTARVLFIILILPLLLAAYGSPTSRVARVPQTRSRLLEEYLADPHTVSLTLATLRNDCNLRCQSRYPPAARHSVMPAQSAGFACL